MAINYSYSPIGALSAGDILNIVDISNGNSTKTVELGQVSDYVIEQINTGNNVVAKIVITEAQMLTLADTPIVVVPAVGENEIISIDSVSIAQPTGLQYFFGFGNYAFLFSNAPLNVVGATDYAVDYVDGEYAQTSAGYIVTTTMNRWNTEMTNAKGNPLILTTSVNPFNGTGDVTLWVRYSIIDVS